jgi:hypothetical protein
MARAIKPAVRETECRLNLRSDLIPDGLYGALAAKVANVTL